MTEELMTETDERDTALFQTKHPRPPTSERPVTLNI